MELFKTEKYGTIDRDFLIHTYRNNNGRTITIEPTEITGGKSTSLPELRSVFIIQDDESLNLKAEEYKDYPDQLAAVKQSIIIYVNQSLP